MKGGTACRHEVEAIVSFYEALCQLAQKLKALDPFCMLFLQQVSPLLHLSSPCQNLLFL